MSSPSRSFGPGAACVLGCAAPVASLRAALGAKARDVREQALASSEDTGASILKRADQALYRAKRDGRNRVVADAA